MRSQLAQTILLQAGKLAKRLDPENVTITIRNPEIGGAASRAERFAETGDTDVLLEGLALREEIKAALEGNSNDAEHDALVSVAASLGIEYRDPYDVLDDEEES